MIPDALSYELSAVAPSLFLDDGQMRNNNKADLMNDLLNPGKVEDYPVDSHHVFDGCAWLYQTAWPKIGMISDLYKLFLKGVLYECKSRNQITVCFDDYETDATKGPEQKRRKHGVSTMQFDVKLNTPIPGDRQKFLADRTNKQRLIDLFSSLLMQDGVSVRHAVSDGDADTLIVKESLTNANQSTVVVHSFDTDVFVILLHHCCDDLHDIFMTTKKGIVSIKNVIAALDDDLRKCLLFSHAISGCDSCVCNLWHWEIKSIPQIKKISALAGSDQRFRGG